MRPTPYLSLFVFALVPLGVSSALADKPELPPFDPSPPVVPERARLFDAPSVDARPGPWACNVQTLLDEISCVLGGRVSVAPGVATKNEAMASEVGGQVCTALERETRDPRHAARVRALCDARVSDVAPLCGGGTSALLDDDAHFGADHALCYGALLGVVREIRAVGQTWAPCCACLVDAGCSPGFRACADDIARCASPQLNEGAGCDAARCEATCRATELLAPRRKEKR